MCGRYTLTKPLKAIKKHFEPIILSCDHDERYNISPGQNIPIVTATNSQRELKLMRWGLIPSWVKNIKTTKPLINARSETVHQKPSFRHPFHASRCLIPADGFLEWKTEGGKKFPYFIFLNQKDIFSFAGIWTKWCKETSPIHTFSILTTQANTILAPIHERMPVIIKPSDYKSWLEPGTDSSTLRSLLLPFGAKKMYAHPVSTEINSYKNNRDGLLNRIN
jgi:putative SOS response-associated peptidase YedK